MTSVIDGSGQEWPQHHLEWATGPLETFPGDLRDYELHQFKQFSLN